MDFKFIRTEDNQFIWTDEVRYKIVYKNPSIQAFEDYVQINSESSILYYYYNFEIYDKNNLNEWQLFNSIRTCNFPSIVDLKSIIESMLECDITENSECYKIEDGVYLYSRSLDTIGMWSEDAYELKKLYREDIDVTFYEFLVGVQDKYIKLINLSETDLIQLYQCVKSFIDYSIENYNLHRQMFNKIYFKQTIIVDGSIYQYAIDYENLALTDKLEEVFYVGDTLSNIIVIFNGNETKHPSNFKDCKILEANEDTIKVFHEGKEIQIPINRITLMWRDINEDEYSYSMEEIANDFIEHFSATEIKDYLNLSNEELFEKYQNVIISRHELCRDEHHFLDNYNPTDDKDNIQRNSIIYGVVRKIIEIIKNSLLERTYN